MFALLRRLAVQLSVYAFHARVSGRVGVCPFRFKAWEIGFHEMDAELSVYDNTRTVCGLKELQRTESRC